MSVFSFRQYDAARDEEPALALWLRSWQKTYPDIDFAGRLAWWRDHWRGLARTARITIAEAKNETVGFVTVDPGTLYLDQIVVAPEYWGTGLASALIAEELAAVEAYESAHRARRTILTRVDQLRTAGSPPAPDEKP